MTKWHVICCSQWVSNMVIKRHGAYQAVQADRFWRGRQPCLLDRSRLGCGLKLDTVPQNHMNQHMGQCSVGSHRHAHRNSPSWWCTLVCSLILADRGSQSSRYRFPCCLQSYTQHWPHMRVCKPWGVGQGDLSQVVLKHMTKVMDENAN